MESSYGSGRSYPLNEDVVRFCSQACNVKRQTIAQVYPAHQHQADQMQSHVETGTFMEMLVFAFDKRASAQQKRFFIKAFNTIRKRNDVLRTRLIRLGERTLQVVVNDEAQWLVGGTLTAYLKKNQGSRMDYGKPLFRYALLDESSNEPTVFLWTCTLGHYLETLKLTVTFTKIVHHSCIDSW